VRFIYGAISSAFLILQGWAATQYLSESPGVTEIVIALGYPLYLMKILAAVNLLGIAALVVSSSVALREWAYAGFVFEAAGAFASHLCAGDSHTFAILPVISLTLVLASYASWKQLLRQAGLRRRHYGFGLGPRDPAETLSRASVPLRAKAE